MQITLTGSWTAWCDVVVTYKGRQIPAVWSTDSGYEISEAVYLTDDERDELCDALEYCPTPILRFHEDAYEEGLELLWDDEEDIG